MLAGVQLYEKTDEGQLAVDAVGRPVVHVSAVKQATGEAVYIDDMPPLEGTCMVNIHVRCRCQTKTIIVRASSLAETFCMYR